jgi:hypothetical protein
MLLRGPSSVESLKRYIGEAADEMLEAARQQLKLARCPHLLAASLAALP